MSNTVIDPLQIELTWLREDVTTTTEAIGAVVGTDSFDVADGSLFAAGDFILIEQEQMEVLSVAGNTLTVTRQTGGSYWDTYDSGVSVGLFKKRRFKLMAPFRPQAVDRFPGKVTIGDYSKDSNDILSAWVISDLTGGHGIADLREGVDDNRYRFGTIYTRYPSQWSKPFAISKSTLGAGSVFPLGDQYYSGTVYRMAASGTTLYQNTTNRGALTGAPSEKGVSYAGTASQALYYIPQGNNGYSTFNPATNTLTNNNTGSDPDVQAFLLWDEKLLAIENDGTLSYATTAAATTSFAPYTLGGSDLKLDNSFDIKRMHVFYNRVGDAVPFVVTSGQVWAFDPDTPRFYRIPDFESVHPYFGLASAVWRGELYVASGMDILAFNGEVIRNVGLSRDDGLPYTYQNYIRDLVPGQNALYALVRGRTTLGVTYTSVHEWSGFGWHCIYAGNDANIPVRALVSAAGDNYKLHWGLGGSGTLFTQDLPVSFTNPRESIAQGGDVIMGDFTETSVIDGDTYYTKWYTLETGRFDANMKGYRKIAQGLEVDVRSIAATAGIPPEQLGIHYRIDNDDEWIILRPSTGGTTIDTAGVHRYPMGGIDPNGHYVGVDFEKIEFKFTILDAIPNPYIQSDSIVIESAVFSFQKRMHPSLAWTADIDMREEFHDASRATMMTELTELRTLNHFFSLRYGTKTYRGILTGQSGIEEGGHDPGGMFQVSILEIPELLGVGP